VHLVKRNHHVSGHQYEIKSLKNLKRLKFYVVKRHSMNLIQNLQNIINQLVNFFTVLFRYKISLLVLGLNFTG